MNPKVSILLPFKNAAPWIEETLKSIQEQSFQNWELIAVDDFSEDLSYSILESFATNDGRISILKNSKKGIIPALQLGLVKAQGSFISRMDADDRMPKDRLMQFANKLASSPEKTVITGKVNYFSDQAVSEGYLDYQAWLNDRIDKKDHYQHIYRECIIASPNWMTRKEDLVRDNIFENLTYPEDYDMVFQWHAHKYTIDVTPEVTLFWREHPKRTSRNSAIYDQASFFELKTKWFLKNFGDKKIGILGVNQKGKLVSNKLHNDGISFNWYDLNHEDYNQEINGCIIENPEEIDCEVLILGIYPKKRALLIDFLEKQGFEIGVNAFWF